MDYPPGAYDREAGYARLQAFLDSLGRVTRKYAFGPKHDMYGQDEFLQKHGFTVVTCLKIGGMDTTDGKIIDAIDDLVRNYDVQCICIGSGDRHFVPALKKAKEKGIKVAVVYASDSSLNWEMRQIADSYPDADPLNAGDKMLHFFSPVNQQKQLK